MKCSVTVARSLRDAVASRPAFLQVRGRHRQDVLVPFARREPHRGVKRIVGRMGTSIHPDGPFRAPRKVMRMNRDELLRGGVAFLPDPHASEAGDVVGRVHAALIFRQGDQGGVPGVGAETHRVVHWQSCVVAELGSEQAIGPVLLKDPEVVPDARQIHVRTPARRHRGKGSTKAKGQRQKAKVHRQKRAELPGRPNLHGEILYHRIIRMI
jgi:hypothetical protein